MMPGDADPVVKDLCLRAHTHGLLVVWSDARQMWFIFEAHTAELKGAIRLQDIYDLSLEDASEFISRRCAEMAGEMAPLFALADEAKRA